METLQPFGSGITGTAEAVGIAPRLRLAEKAAKKTGIWTVEKFLLFEAGCQLVLIVPALASIRSILRVAAFGASLYMLASVRKTHRWHPAAIPLLVVLLILFVSIFNPTTNSWAAGVAQATLYLAILAPVFWMPGIKIEPVTLNRAVLVLWGFCALSALVGVLQVRFPGSLQPPLAPQYANADISYQRSYLIETNSGASVLRPMGLTDTPGGAAVGGFYALLLGIALFVIDERRFMRGLYLGGMIVGAAAVALSQVRSVLVMGVISVGVFFVLLLVRSARLAAVRGDRHRLRIGKLIVVLMVTLGLAAWVATSLAEKSVTDRIGSLFAGSGTGDVYYQSRGYFIDYTLNILLPKYPLGAGLGRWGMMYQYFGDPHNLDSPREWVEIQWTGWLLDGGVPLVIAYAAALLLCLNFAFKTALKSASKEIAVVAALVFAYDMSAVADTFAYAFFIGQTGLQFWLLNALLFAAVHTSRRLNGRDRSLRWNPT